jgi:hypothetical protein
MAHGTTAATSANPARPAARTAAGFLRPTTYPSATTGAIARRRSNMAVTGG